jgi:hypothetical protein
VAGLCGVRVGLDFRPEPSELKFLTLFLEPLPIGIGMRENLQIDGERFLRDTGPCRPLFRGQVLEKFSELCF